MRKRSHGAGALETGGGRAAGQEQWLPVGEVLGQNQDHSQRHGGHRDTGRWRLLLEPPLLGPDPGGRAGVRGSPKRGQVTAGCTSAGCP